MSAIDKGHAEALTKLAAERGVTVDELVNNGHRAPKRGRWLTRMVWIFAALTCATLISGLHEISGAGEGIAYRLNRLTGETSICDHGKCGPVQEQ